MKTNAIENIIFNHFREKQKKQLKRIRKLKKDGYIVYKRKSK
mgnify:CR=1 FL=1